MQKQVAAELGINQRVYSNYETGKRRSRRGCLSSSPTFTEHPPIICWGEQTTLNRINKRKLCAVLLALLLLLFGCRTVPQADTLELHMLDVGNADCFLLKQGRTAMLIDGGEPDDADHIVSYLHTHGVERLDAIIVSHPHADHIGSVERVIEAYETDVVYYACLPEELQEETLMHTRLAETIAKKAVTLQEASDGAVFSLGGARVEIYPVSVSSDDANDYSLVARVSFANEHILFTGDATEKAQRAMINSGLDITADILKVSHHGGKISTTRAFLEAVDPQVALISCGIENAYGHPHKDTLTALAERGIICYRSDVCGHTVITLREQGEHFIETAY